MKDTVLPVDGNAVGDDVGGKSENMHDFESKGIQFTSPTSSCAISVQVKFFPTLLPLPKFPTARTSVEFISSKIVPGAAVAVFDRKHESDTDRDPLPITTIAPTSPSLLSNRVNSTVRFPPTLTIEANPTSFSMNVQFTICRFMALPCLGNCSNSPLTV